jgi:hypothetical protein
MADLLSNLPEELCHQIFGGTDKHTLTQMARMSKRLNIDASGVLYRELESPWPLIQLLLEPALRAATPADTYRSPNPGHGFVCSPFVSGSQTLTSYVYVHSDYGITHPQ